MEEQKEKESSSWLIWVLVGCSIVAICVSFYFFYYQKNYDFIVEVSCDPSAETCFERDCSNPDDCPPNGLSNFKRYSLNAADFAMCENEDCTNACESGTIKCEQMECVEDEIMGETCISAESPVNEE